jgi:hypothetical protein
MDSTGPSLSEAVAGRMSAAVGILTFYGVSFPAHLSTMSFIYLLLVMTVATLGGFSERLQTPIMDMPG